MNGKNLKAALEAKHMSQVDLAETLNVTAVTVSRWVNGTREPSDKIKMKLVELLGVPIEFLMGSQDDTKKAPADPKVSEGRKERRLISMDDWIEVPVVSREWTACCGKGIPALDITSGGEPPVRIERSTLHSYDDMRPPFAIRCEGDSLESAGIHDGDRAVINPAEEPAQGCVALVSRAGSLSLKRVYMLPSGDIVLRNDYGSTRLTPEEQERDELCICGAFICGTYGRPPALPL